jgi:hypothetical protein
MKNRRALGGCGWNFARVSSPIAAAIVGSLAASSAKADLFVTDGDVLDRFNSSTGAIIQTNGQDAFTTSFGATGVRVGPDGLVYLANTNPGLDPNLAVVNRYNASTGQKVGNGFVKYANDPSQLSVPEGLAFGPGGNLYVADQGDNGPVKVFDSSGAFVTSYVPQGGNSQAVAFDPAMPNKLFVTTESTIESFDLSTHANAIVVQGQTGTFNAATDLAFDSSGTLYVLDASTSGGPQILAYPDADATKQTVFASFATTSFQPIDMTFGPDGLLYISGLELDASTSQQGEVIKMSASGSSSSVLVSNLNNPGFLSFTAVPEPGSAMLLVLSGIGLSLRRRGRG